ncbi:sugar transferase [Daejeonella sp. JGW-45]|uniref:sugar transferase n=1 Tax=Daejeonella sp. JGW-45 TaxID=3034148 RepID=UPI0023EC868B|nr:sugar transferase [Daejeonella sp. JGW-45]
MSSQTVKPSYQIESLQLSIAFMGTEQGASILAELPSHYTIEAFPSPEGFYEYLSDQSILTLPDIILIETDPQGSCFDLIEKIKTNPLWRDLIIVVIANQKNRDWKLRALQLKIHDYYIVPFPIDHLLERLNFLVKFKLVKPQLSWLENADVTYKLPLGKKLFDLVFSSLGIVLLSPVMLLTALLIKLDSKGPVIYKSKRVGTGYNIFDFYKFRSMRKDADTELENFAELNRYRMPNENNETEPAFVKLKNDPRITRLGALLRKTSIDELPQLFNVLKGEMSLVGNRPLPLYEAEMLTSNEWSQRFLGPAGVTGLWQIKSRGKNNVSARERKKFDNFYASKYSFWFDVEILIKTLPVIFYKEKI